MSNTPLPAFWSMRINDVNLNFSKMYQLIARKPKLDAPHDCLSLIPPHFAPFEPRVICASRSFSIDKKLFRVIAPLSFRKIISKSFVLVRIKWSLECKQLINLVSPETCPCPRRSPLLSKAVANRSTGLSKAVVNRSTVVLVTVFVVELSISQVKNSLLELAPFETRVTSALKNLAHDKKLLTVVCTRGQVRFLLVALRLGSISKHHRCFPLHHIHKTCCHLRHWGFVENTFLIINLCPYQC